MHIETMTDLRIKYIRLKMIMRKVMAKREQKYKVVQQQIADEINMRMQDIVNEYEVPTKVIEIWDAEAELLAIHPDEWFTWFSGPNRWEDIV